MVLGTYRDVVAARLDDDVVVLDPCRLRRQQEHPQSDPCSVVLEWAEGIELLSGRPALVPVANVLCPYDGPGAGLWTTSSHGLASGSSLAEAVSHALAELIERDAVTLAAVLDRLRGDVMADIDLMVRALRDAGVGQVFAVEVSHYDIPAAVVKLVAPELECWFLYDFAEDAARLGPRARRYLDLG